MGVFNRLVVTTLPFVPKPLVGLVAKRYVAGETLEAAFDTVRDLNARGAMATLDVLGEEVVEPARATAFTDQYVEVLAQIEQSGLDTNVSIKPTMLGLGIDEALCAGNIERIVAAAKKHGNFVRIDMEDASTTDATLAIYHDLQRRYGNVGCVLQAYMRRTLADIESLPREGASVRLCKGIYIEPRSIAWKGFDTVRRNFVAALDKMIRQGVYAAIATHDEYLVCAATELLERHQVPKDRYEFQMLLGVEEPLRDILLAEGHRVRIYIPFGPDWYHYSIRRLRENPEVAGHVMRAFLRRD